MRELFFKNNAPKQTRSSSPPASPPNAAEYRYLGLGYKEGAMGYIQFGNHDKTRRNAPFLISDPHLPRTVEFYKRIADEKMANCLISVSDRLFEEFKNNPKLSNIKQLLPTRSELIQTIAKIVKLAYKHDGMGNVMYKKIKINNSTRLIAKTDAASKALQNDLMQELSTLTKPINEELAKEYIRLAVKTSAYLQQALGAGFILTGNTNRSAKLGVPMRTKRIHPTEIDAAANLAAQVLELRKG